MKRTLADVAADVEALKSRFDGIEAALRKCEADVAALLESLETKETP